MIHKYNVTIMIPPIFFYKLVLLQKSRHVYDCITSLKCVPNIYVFPSSKLPQIMELVREMFSNSADFDSLMDFLQSNFTNVYLGSSKLLLLAVIAFATIVIVYVTLNRLESKQRQYTCIHKILMCSLKD